MRSHGKTMSFLLSLLYLIGVVIINLLSTSFVVFVVVIGLNYSLDLELDFKKVLVFYLCLMLICSHFKQNVLKFSE